MNNVLLRWVENKRHLFSFKSILIKDIRFFNAYSSQNYLFNVLYDNNVYKFLFEWKSQILYIILQFTLLTFISHRSEQWT